MWEPALQAINAEYLTLLPSSVQLDKIILAI
jgi:hypothetical protein